jgi:hypothetical protein
MPGKRRLNFASFTTKERLNFPVATAIILILLHMKIFWLENSMLIDGKY